MSGGSKQPIQQIQTPGNRQLNEGIIDKFLDVQSQKIILDTKQLTLREKELEVNGVHATEALKLHAEDLKDKRRYEYKKAFMNAGIVVFGLLSILSICIYSMYLNQFKFALDILEKVVVPIVTGVAGYYIGKAKKATKGAEKEDKEE
jgi:hypothetical protein